MANPGVRKFLKPIALASDEAGPNPAVLEMAQLALSELVRLEELDNELGALEIELDTWHR